MGPVDITGKQMALPTYLISSLVMLLIVLAVGYVLSHSRRRESTRLSGSFLALEPSEAGGIERLGRVIETPIGWSVAFLVLLALALLSAIAAVSADGIPIVAFGAVLGVGLLAFFWYGVHRTFRIRGHSNAMSTFQSTVLIGILVIVAVVGHLTLLS